MEGWDERFGDWVMGGCVDGWEMVAVAVGDWGLGGVRALIGERKGLVWFGLVWFGGLNGLGREGSGVRMR